MMYFYKKFKKIFLFTVIFIIVFGWLFSGWPQIWQNPKIPSETKEVKAATADFNIQRGCETPSSGTGTVTLTAGTDYTAPANNSYAFIRLVSTRLSGMGDTVGGGTQEADDWTWYISDPDFAGGSVVFTRAGAANPQRFCWEIIEYVGDASGNNEMIVRDVGTVTYGSGNTTADGSSVSGVSDDNDIVVFITGQDALETSDQDEVGAGLNTSEWLSGTDVPRFTRGFTGSDTNHISYAVVEFTGSNWVIERVTHTFSAVGATETETITDVGALDRAFAHVQFRRDAEEGLADSGTRMYFSATNQLSFYLNAAADLAGNQHHAVVWVIKNSDTTSETKMNVQHINGTRTSGGTSEGANNEEDEWTETITAVSDTSQTSIMGESGESAGQGTAFPRGWISIYLNSTTGVKLYHSDDGQTQNYDFQVVEWPQTAAVAADVTVSTIGSQTSSMYISSTDNYVGGTFVIAENTSSRNVTGITIAETGSIDADTEITSNSVRLYYETSSDCSGESFSDTWPTPSETLFDTADSFSSSSVSFTNAGIGITTSLEMCVYVVFDVDATADEGDEIEIQISDPSSDVTVDGGGTVGPGSAVAISGTTTVSLPGVTGSLGKSEDSWCGAVPVYMTLDGLDNGDYPYARAKVDTPATETYYISMTWDSGDERYEGTIYIGSWYCDGCADPNTGSYSVTVQLDNNAGFPSIDYSDATSGFTTWAIRRKSGEDNSTNYADILPVWNTDHWDIAVNDLTIQTDSGTESDVAVALPFIPDTASISNMAVEFNGSSVSEGSPESTSDAWWWDSNSHTLYLLINSLTSTENSFDVNLDFDSDTDLWATRFDRVRTKDMGGRNFYNGLFIGNQYITTSVYGGAGEGSQSSWEGSGEQAESRAKQSGAAAEDTIDCMERVGIWVDDSTNCDSSGYYGCNIKWKQDEWDDILVSADNSTMVVEVNSDDNASTGWEQQKDYDIAVKRTQTYYAEEKYIKNVYEITNGDTSAHELSMVWGREQWLSSDRDTNDRGRADGDSSDQTLEARITMSSLDCPWFTSYDNSAYNAMGVIFEDGDEADHGYFLTSAPIQNSASAEWPIDYGQSGTNAENTFFEKVYSSVGASQTETFTFWFWGYDTTSWSNIESAIDADCSALNVSNQTPTVTNVSLNSGSNISLTENTTVQISATATVSDADGYADISSATGKIYRSGVSGGSSCTANDNNCYADASCDLSGCSGNSCTATCSVDMQFHADPTDTGTPWSSEEWVAWIEGTDSQSATGSADNSSSQDIDVISLLALDVTSSINYGSLNPGESNDPLDKITTITATGNVSLDVTLYGTNMTSGGDTIVVGQQKYALSSSTAYSSGITLLVDPGAEAEINCCKTFSSASKATDDVWWGIEIPNPQAAGSYSGTNTFIGVKNEWSGAGDWCE